MFRNTNSNAVRWNSIFHLKAGTLKLWGSYQPKTIITSNSCTLYESSNYCQQKWTGWILETLPTWPTALRRRSKRKTKYLIARAQGLLSKSWVFLTVHGPVSPPALPCPVPLTTLSFGQITTTNQHKIQVWLTRKDFKTKVCFDKTLAMVTPAPATQSLLNCSAVFYFQFHWSVGAAWEVLCF